MLTKTLYTYRDAYRGLSKSTWLLSLVMLINRCGTMVVPFMSLYLTSPSMGYSIGQAGFVYGMFGAGAFAGAFLGGKATDRFGFYRVQIITLSGGGLLFILLGQMKSYGWICFFTFLLSFVNEAFRPANSTAIAFYSREENRTRSYSLNRLAINLGWAIGSAIGGVLAKYNYHLLFWVDGLTNMVAAVLLASYVKPGGHRPASPVPDHRQEDKSHSAFRDRNYLWFILCTTLFASCFFQLFTNLTVYFKKVLHFSEPLIGSLMAMNGMVIVLVEMVLIYKLEGKRKNTVYILTGSLLLTLSYLMLNLFPMGVLMAMVMILTVTFGEILAMPFMNSYWIARSSQHNRGQYAALYTMAWSVAQTFGPMLGAQVVEQAGFSALWWVVSGFCLVAVGAFYRLHTWGSRHSRLKRGE